MSETRGMLSIDPTTKDIDRFWSKVDRSGSCWLWTGTRTRKGYGSFQCYRDRRSVSWGAHRVAFTIVVGPIPDGLVVDHICRVRACVNPARLRAVTEVENTMAGVGFGAINARKTRCDYGHELSDENTLIDGHGWRICRACNRRRASLVRSEKPKATCDICGGQFNRGNLQRHIRRVHERVAS